MRRGFLFALTAGAVLAAAIVGQRPQPSRVDSPDAVSDRIRTPSCDALVDSLPQRQRLGQLLMVGVPSGDVDTATQFARDVQVGGIFVHDNPTPLLTGGRLAEVKSAAHLPLAVAVDEEGGRVQTARQVAGDLPSARVMAASLTPVQVRTEAADRGRFLHKVGVTMDFAPVVDVTDRPANTVIGDRSFSADPVTARTYAQAFATGLSSAGVLPVLKHFPGHGNANGDSHKGTATTPPLARLLAVDLVPYEDITGYGPVGVMLGHLVVPGLTGDQPATLAAPAYQLLRDRFRFDGLIVTDDLGAMRAIVARYDLPTAVLRAVQAGADMALWTSGARVSEVLDRLESAVRSGELTGERVRQAVRHVLTSKGVCAS